VLVLMLVITVIILILLILVLDSTAANIADHTISAERFRRVRPTAMLAISCQTLPISGEFAVARRPKWPPKRAYVRYIRYSFRLTKCLRKR